MAILRVLLYLVEWAQAGVGETSKQVLGRGGKSHEKRVIAHWEEEA